jgi:hypothetical protein
VEERPSTLIEEGLRWRGLRGGTLPLGDEDDKVRWPRLRTGEEDMGDEGSAVDEAALIVS